MILALIGTALCVFGLFALYRAWQRKTKNTVLVVAGWGLLLGGVIAWGYTSGPDKGPALGIVAAVLIALCFLSVQLFRAERRPMRSKPKRVLEPVKLTTRDYLSRIWTGVLIGPIAGLSALALCTASFSVFKSMNVEHTLNLTLVSFAFPLLWGGLAVFAGYSTKGLAKTATLLASGLVSLAYIVVSG